MSIKHGRHICLEKFTRCAKVCGLFFPWMCFRGDDWLGRQTPITWTKKLTAFSPHVQRTFFYPHLWNCPLLYPRIWLQQWWLMNEWMMIKKSTKFYHGFQRQQSHQAYVAECFFLLFWIFAANKTKHCAYPKLVATQVNYVFRNSPSCIFVF